MSEPQAARAPLGLRVIHAIVFLGFASAAIAGTHVELMHLFRSLAHPYHSGSLPEVLPCVSGLLAVVLGLALLVQLVRGRPVPLAVSALLLAAFGLSFTVLLDVPALRSVPGANAKALEVARAVHEPLNDGLQNDHRVPDAVTAPAGESPFRRRGYAALPWHVAKVPHNDALPPGAEPGWFLLQVAGDQSGFSVTSVGVNAEGEAALLRDENGDPIELKGAFNPDTSK